MPSPLKSATAGLDHTQPSAAYPPFNALKVPSPSPSSTVTSPLELLEATRSMRPSPSMSARLTATGKKPAHEYTPCRNVPSPAFRKVVMLLFQQSAVAMSGNPSPFKSPTAVFPSSLSHMLGSPSGVTSAVEAKYPPAGFARMTSVAPTRSNLPSPFTSANTP